MWFMIRTPIFLASLIVLTVDCDEHERRLYKKLLENYEILERPVANNSDAVVVKLGIILQQIVDLDEKNQVLELNAWLKYTWSNYLFVWNPEDYGGVSDVRFPTDKIWKPDVLLYNSVDSNFDSTFHSNMLVYYDGTVNWIPPGIFRLACKVDIKYFPFDEQHCYFKFGSWTYDGFKLDLRPDDPGMDTSEYLPNGEWAILSTPVERNLKYYDCCVEPYPALYFYIKMRRRTLYYGFNLIIPSLLISLMTILGFTLPPDAGEKITLESYDFYFMSVTVKRPGSYWSIGNVDRIRLREWSCCLYLMHALFKRCIMLYSYLEITILLSICFFLSMVADMSPPTSEAVPLLGVFFTSCMMIVSASVFFTVLVLNLHYRTPDMHEMSHFTRSILLHWLPWMMMMKRPGVTFNKHKLPNPFSSSKDLESESLIRNVKSIEESVNEPNSNIRRLESIDLEHRISQCLKMLAANEGGMDPGQQALLLMLQRVHTELRFITRRMEQEDSDTEAMNDWKFAAMVVDRICLIIFSITIVSSSCGILFSAPYLIA